jgi:hypothetical protein
MSFWKRIFGGTAQPAGTMFDAGLPTDKLTIEIVKQIAAGTTPSTIIDHLVQDLGMPRDIASNMVTAGQYVIQDDPNMSQTQEKAFGVLASRAAPTPGEVAQRLIDRPPDAKPHTPTRSYTEGDLAKLGSFEVRMPSSDGRCSDNNCPCPPPGTSIPRGNGFLYVDAAVVTFRQDARTDDALNRKAARIQADLQSRGAVILHDPAVYKAILMCEQGAKKRHVDLKVAAEDARLAWAENRAPLRATPKRG